VAPNRGHAGRASARLGPQRRRSITGERESSVSSAGLIKGDLAFPSQPVTDRPAHDQLEPDRAEERLLRLDQHDDLREPDSSKPRRKCDQLGLDSDYDYDPLWQKCRELGIAPTFHTGGRSYGERNSPSNFTFNATPYYFGCEADDRMNAVAFGNAMPLGARINAIYSSDVGHFDVVDMRDPLPEAFELVEEGSSPRVISTTSSSATPYGCGAYRTRASSRARRWPGKRADLMRHALNIDVLACPRCSGRLRLIATVEDPGAIRAILDALAESRELTGRAPPLAAG
jgi:hypothetical protein